MASLAGFHSGASSISVREQLMSLPTSENLGGQTTRPLVAGNAFSFQAANAPHKNQRAFSFGNRLFNTNWVEAPASVKSFDGLGPLFNRVSCSGCHTKDGRGQPPASGQGPMSSMLLRISIPGTNGHGGPLPVPGYGDQLSERAIAGVAPEGRVKIAITEQIGTYGDGTTYTLLKPSYKISDEAYGLLPTDLAISPRVAPQMIGLGLLEAVPASVIEALADPNDLDGDGISGRINRVWNVATGAAALGRFGWKAGQPSLIAQNAAAARGDIGLTTTLFPGENCEDSQLNCVNAITGGAPEISDEFLQKLTLYTQSLAVPAQRNAQADTVKKGAELFREMNCASCHMPTLETAQSTQVEISQQKIHPYTDLLLHDMGVGLSDDRPEFLATGQEWRTPPLWGLGLVPVVNGHNRLLHDGRARGFAEAILWHSGEAETAKEKFRNASKLNRQALLVFLQSL